MNEGGIQTQQRVTYVKEKDIKIKKPNLQPLPIGCSNIQKANMATPCAPNQGDTPT